MSRRPRILFLGQTLPFPPDGGVHIRMYHTLRLLSEAFDVTALLFFRREERPTPASVREGLAGLSFLHRVEAYPLPQEFARIRWIGDHLRSTLTGRAYTWYAYDSAAVHARIASLRATEAFDLAHIDSLDLAAYLPDLAGLPVACAHHNVESALLERRARRDRHPVRGRYLALQATFLERLEAEWCGRVALNVCVSPEDAAVLRRHAPRTPFVVVPNGADTTTLVPVAAPITAEVLGVGGLNWGPNREALEFLCQEILSPLRARRPEVRVRWVGRASEADRREYRDRHGVELTGYVDDVRPYLAGAATVVAPLLAGGGTRLKILDAWAMGKAVVSTRVGAEGLTARDGENILLRDDADGFAAAIAEVVGDAPLRERLGRAARRTVETTYAWDVIGGPMIATYRTLIRGAPVRQAAAS